MSKVIDTTYIEDSEFLLTQTPPNFVEDNYYLKEIQDKVDADWNYRPNRKWIEEEKTPGEEDYQDIDVVVQSVVGEKGEKISDDWYKLTFKDCRRINRIGKRYRFSYRFNKFEHNAKKNIWIGLNNKNLSATSSQVVCRCNGTLGSIYTDCDGKNHIHYEPVIQPSKSTSAMFQFSEVAIDPGSQLMIIAQHNKYTMQYYINQRFVVGYDSVYKINSINRVDSLSTYDPMDVGVVRIYLAKDQIGDHDDMENRIAYNGIKDEPIVEHSTGIYKLLISEPANVPEFLTEEDFIFKPQVILGDVPQSTNINVSLQLVGPNAEYVEIEDYCSVSASNDGSFLLHRIKENLGLSVLVTCTANPDGEELKIEFEMKLRDF